MLNLHPVVLSAYATAGRKENLHNVMYVLNIYNYSNSIESFVEADGEPCVTAHTRLPTDPQVNSTRTTSKENKFGSKAQNPRPKGSNSLSRQFQ
jgi:hypothetical protein